MNETCSRCGTVNPLGGIYGWQDHVNDDGTVVESLSLIHISEPTRTLYI